MSTPTFRLAMLAAHGGRNSNLLPLGGGAAVCERLLQAWAQVPALHLTLIVPGPRRGAADPSLERLSELYPPERLQIVTLPLLPSGQAPCHLSTWGYARFCRRFEREATRRVLELKPDAVLTHDISEGPNFKRLAQAGIPCLPIFHVDVLDFFCRMYLGERWTPAQCERFWSRLRPYPICPDILRLVFDKQYEAVATCPRLIVPSQGMKEVMLATYPQFPDLQERIAVVPWGAPTPLFSPSQIEDGVLEINRRFNLQPEDPVIVMLSRLSPEKAQHKLLEALQWGEQLGGIPAHLTVIICGAAAYMEGRSFARRLQRLEKNLHRVRLLFPGHIGGLEKAALLARADLFVSTSRHESYGLTTMEAMAQGTPVVALDTPGARQTVVPHTGLIVPSTPPTAQNLWQAIHSILMNPAYRRILSRGAKIWSQTETFLGAAQAILDLLSISQAHPTGDRGQLEVS